MSFDLVARFNKSYGQRIEAYVNDHFAIPADQATAIVDLVLPVIIALVSQKGNTDRGAQSLLGQLAAFHEPRTMPGNSDAVQLIAQGSPILKQLFHDHLAGFADEVTKLTGAQPQQFSDIAKITAFGVFELLARNAKEQSMDAQGLKSFLLDVSSQHRSLPGDLMSTAGLTNLSGHETQDPGSSTTPIQMEVESSPLVSKIMPWIVLLIASMALLYFIGRGCGSPVIDSPQRTAEEVAARDSAEAPQMLSIAMPSGKMVHASANSMIGQFATALTQDPIRDRGPFVLDKLKYTAGSAQIPDEARTQLQILTSILMEYPALTIRLEGHTDDSGNAEDNLKLSQQRALAVKAFLQNNGLDPGRMRAFGRGQTKPMVSNDLRNEKSANNRVEIYLSED